jgi:glycosyltransferase involved in cell wall biosynthesis
VHVLHLAYFYDRDIPCAEALLERYSTTTHFCASLHAQGVERVSVLQRFSRTTTLVRDGVTHYFVADRLRPDLRPWEDPQAVHAVAAQLRPDVIHHHGRAAPLGRLSSLLPRRTVFLSQYHGGAPPAGRTRWWEQQGFGVLDGMIFTAKRQAAPWKAAGLVQSRHAIYELTEGSTHFGPRPRDACRHRVGWRGDPLLLWVGRLNPNKDPLTVLQGLAHVVEQLPDPHLYMVYQTEELLPQVQETARTLDLTARVHLVGRQPHQALPHLYSAADYFVLGSHHEGSGYALLEALACGLTPVVTDIPSFRRITDGGRLGALWRPGSSAAFAHALLRASRQRPSRRAIRQYFQEHWSFPALGRTAAALYARAVWRKAPGR